MVSVLLLNGADIGLACQKHCSSQDAGADDDDDAGRSLINGICDDRDGIGAGSGDADDDDDDGGSEDDDDDDGDDDEQATVVPLLMMTMMMGIVMVMVLMEYDDEEPDSSSQCGYFDYLLHYRFVCDHG